MVHEHAVRKPFYPRQSDEEMKVKGQKDIVNVTRNIGSALNLIGR